MLAIATILLLDIFIEKTMKKDKQTQKEKNIAPTIYLEPYFEIYRSGMTFVEIIKRVIKVYEDNKWNQDIDDDFIKDYES